MDRIAHLGRRSSSASAAGVRISLLIFLISTAVGLFFTAQIYFSAATAGQAVSWAQALYWAMGDWYEWALLSPFIFWICRRFPFERHSCLRNLAFQVMGALVFAVVHAGLCALAASLQAWVTATPGNFTVAWSRLLASRIHFNLAVYALIVAAWHAWNYHRGLREREALAADLAARLNEAQLRSLRMQLNPHFLFNTLNAISSLMLKDVAGANAMIVRLSELLRLTLENSNQQEVPLRQEIDYLKRYLAIQQLRFGDRLDVKLDVDPTTLEAVVPNLILQPLVENAIEHAIESRENEGRIEFRSARNNGSLLLSVSDNGSNLQSDRQNGSHRQSEDHTGIGLNNTRERLLKLYGQDQRLELTSNLLGGTTASVTIPFRPAPAILMS